MRTTEALRPGLVTRLEAGALAAVAVWLTGVVALIITTS